MTNEIDVPPEGSRDDQAGGPGGAPQPRRRRRRGPLLVAALLLLAIAASLVVARLVHLGGPASGSTMSSPAASRPSAGTGSTGVAGSSAGTSAAANAANDATKGGSDPASIASRVDPGLVDINVTLGLQSIRGAGTGMVLTPSGEVLTNNHVIDGATSISVTDVGNGQKYAATVVGYDRAHDLAVLQLQGASGLQTVPIGDSSQTAVGDAVMALGNAGGAGGTPSAASGIVAALDQTITADDAGTGTSERLAGLIQVNADIQPGDSGGPLVNSDGRVIGMDTAASGGYAFRSSGGEGFAIPIDAALAVAKQIEAGVASSTVHLGSTGFLGVEVVSQAQAGFGGGVSGAVLGGVLAGSPAEHAGLTQGDVITSLDRQTVDTPTTLTELLIPHHPGDTVQLGWVDQSGQTHSTAVRLASGPPA